MEAVERYGRPLWVVGSPISHTLSPPIHNAAFRAADLPHRYFALDVQADELDEFLGSFKRLDGLGANLTLPLKECVREKIPQQTEAVQATGAANTLYWSGGDPALDNTDVHGFKELIDPWREQVRTGTVLLLGAGGAARACLQGLKELNVKRVLLWNRTTEKAERLEDTYRQLDITVVSDDELTSLPPEVFLVVNATSLGLEPDDPSPLPADCITEGMVGVDLIYGRETTFLQSFRQRGEAAVDGLGMLIHQAARAWERWVGDEPDIEAMEAAVVSNHSD